MTASRTTPVTVRLGTVLAAQLADRAQLEGATSADILRRALHKYVDEREQHAMLDDLRQSILQRLESLERCIVAEISSLVEVDTAEGGAK